MPKKKKNILVTGASGFVGSNFVSNALKRDSLNITVLARESSNIPVDIKKKCTVVRASLFENKKIEKAMMHIETVYHFAAKLSGFDKGKIYKVNAKGTVNVLKAAIKKKVTNFYFASTIAVYSYGKTSNLPESKVLQKDGRWHYADSKREAEIKIHEIAEQENINVKIFRFGDLIGVGSNWVTPVAKRIKHRKMLLIKKNSGQLNYVWIEDLVSALIKINQANFSNSDTVTYNIVSDSILFNDYFKDLGRILNTRLISLPKIIVKCLVWVESKSLSILHKKSQLDLNVLRYIFTNNKITADTFKRDYNWEPKTPYPKIIQKLKENL